jgi:hypothetical protein
VAGRHDLLLGGVQWLHTAFPTVSLFATARTQLARLVELRADDVAATAHARLDLARALVTMADGMATRGPVDAVPANGGDAAERLQRLMAPPVRLAGAQRAVLILALGALTAVPGVLLAAAHVFPALAACPPSLIELAVSPVVATSDGR